jgi:gliding motility-associated-like protein
MTSAGCPGTDTVTVIVNSPATLVLLATDVLCFGGNTGTTTVTASGGTQPYTYSWNTTPVQTTQTATGLTAGNYSVTVTTADGCISTGTVVCGQPTLLTLSVAGFDATCNGACNGQVVVIPSGGTPQYQYAWSNGCNSPSCNSLCAGPYSITVTDANGCTATGSATVNEPPALVLTTSAITANCNQADGQASVTVTGGTPNYTYSWNTNPVQPGSTATSLFPGPYTVTVTDNYTCTATATVTVPNAPGVAASISSSVNATCNGSCNGSATAQGAGGTGPYTYSWSTSPAQNTQTASNLCAGTYTVTITDTNGCSDTAIVTITEPALVVASPNTPAAICIGQCVTLTSTATGGTGGYTYSWSGGATVCPVVTTTYGVIATDINGCTSATANVTVTVNPPLDVVATGTTAICPGASTPLSATGSGGNGGPYSYQWLPGTGLNNPAIANPSASPSATTTYTVYVSDQCGTPVDSAMVTVTINPLPFVVISSDITAACDTPGCITFADLSTISSGSIVGWAWNFGDNNTSNLQNPSYCYGGPGSYGVTLTATSAQGCVASVFAPYPITIYPEPVAEFNFGPQPTTIASPEICFTDASLFADTWSWDFADPSDITTSTQQNPCHFYSDTGTYCVDLIVTTMNGCNDTVTHCLVIGPDFLIYVPNAFSPNGDNTNDNFVARGIGIDEDNFELFIFDRWGNRIFYTDNYDKGWNGKANGGNEVAQQDVYVWKIVVKDIMGSSHQYMGHVTLIK